MFTNYLYETLKCNISISNTFPNSLTHKRYSQDVMSPRSYSMLRICTGAAALGIFVGA